jgi:coiled-coil domain-containing protein 39
MLPATRAQLKFRLVQVLEKQLEDTEGELETVTDRTKVMEEHLKSVQTELGYTQGRLSNRRQEIHSERHLRALAEREAARLRADIRAMRKERAGLGDRVVGLQGQIFRASERIDQFKVRVPRRV